LVKAILAEMDDYMRHHPSCPRPFAAFEILSKKQGLKTKEILMELNMLNESTYSGNIMGKWRRAERPVPRDVEAYMRGEVLRCTLGTVGDDLVQLLGEQ
jgi:hypothetical protein